MSSMFSSLGNISKRSSNLAFQKFYRTRLKRLKNTMSDSLADSENTLSSYLESSYLHTSKCQHALLEDDEMIFIHAMEHTYCRAMKTRKFKSISASQNWLRAADEIFCDQQPFFVGFEEELHSGASDEEGINRCWGEYAGIADGDDGSSVISASLSESIFASDFDPLDMQLNPSDASHGAEPHDSFPPDFWSILGSVPADSDLDDMSLNATQCVKNGDIFAAKVSQLHTPITIPDSVPSGLGSGPSASSCSEDYRYHQLSEFQVERSASNPSHDFTFSQDISGFGFVTEDKWDHKCPDSPSLLSGNEDSSDDVDLKISCFRQTLDVDLALLSSARFALADTVSEWDFSVDGGLGSFDFVAMEF